MVDAGSYSSAIGSYDPTFVQGGAISLSLLVFLACTAWGARLVFGIWPCLRVLAFGRGCSGKAAMQAIQASSFGDGSLLGNLAQEFCEDFSADGAALPFGRVGATITLYWASTCSGSEVVLLVLLAIACYYQECGVNVKFRHRFSCECKPAKQKWIQGLFDELGVEKGCLFERAEAMTEEYAHCVTHNQKCKVPSCDIMIAGTSCKDFRKASSKLAAAEVLLHTSTSGGSAQTLWALLTYLSLHSVGILLLENSDTLDDANPAGKSMQTALDIVVSEIRSHGMTPCSLLTDSLLFGHPQERRRFYIVAVKSSGSMLFDFAARPLAMVFASLKECLVRCQRQAPCLTELFWPSDSMCVEALLNARVSKGVRVNQYNVSAVVKTYKLGGVRWGDVDLNQELQASIWYGTLPSHVREVFRYSKAEKSEVLCRDISQSVSRVRYSKLVDGRHVVPCKCPEQLVWVEMPGEEPRLQLGKESMLIQGFLVSKVPRLVASTPDNELMSLGGNMMASVLPLAILQSLFVSLPWRPDACTEDRLVAVSEGDVADAMFSFNAMLSEEDNGASQPCCSLKRRRKDTVR